MYGSLLKPYISGNHAKTFLRACGRKKRKPMIPLTRNSLLSVLLLPATPRF